MLQPCVLTSICQCWGCCHHSVPVSSSWAPSHVSVYVRMIWGPCELSVSSTDSLIKILPSICDLYKHKRSLFSICFLFQSLLANRGCPCMFEWSHWVRITRPSLLWLEGKDFHVTHPAMDRKRSCTHCGGAVMLLLLLLGHMNQCIRSASRPWVLHSETKLNLMWFNKCNNPTNVDIIWRKCTQKKSSFLPILF